MNLVYFCSTEISDVISFDTLANRCHNTQFNFFFPIFSQDIYFLLDCKERCRTTICHRLRRASLRYNPAKGHFGFLSEALFQQFIDNYLIIEHLWVGHILRKENPVRSKFLPVYACVKELQSVCIMHLSRY